MTAASPTEPPQWGPVAVETLVLDGVLAMSTEAVIVTDAALTILMFSAGAESIFGYASYEAIGQSLDRLLPERFRASHARKIAAFGAAGAASRMMNERAALYGLRKSGEEFPIEASVSHLRTPQGSVYTAILRDITGRKQAEAEIQEAMHRAEAANAAKSTFLATMSHEIRTPLNGVLGMVQAMAFGPLAPQQRARLDVVRSSGEALLSILNDALDLAKIESGRVELESAPFELIGLARGVRASFADAADAKGIGLYLSSEAASDWRIGDPMRVRQIITNLVSNAIKFTEHGEVRVKLRTADHAVEIQITDTGLGIPTDVLPFLFDTFVQADATTTRKFGGSGLGLSICRQLVQHMDGEISVTSEPGQGSSFRVSLPLPACDAAGLSPPAPGPQASDLAVRVLVAEDNPTNQLVLLALLEQIGITPTFANNGAEAVEAWSGAAFNLILMDVQMPVMDGPAAVREIRRMELEQRRSRTPIIALTANALTHQVQGYLASGMDACLTKPLDATQLFLAVQASLSGEISPV